MSEKENKKEEIKKKLLDPTQYKTVYIKSEDEEAEKDEVVNLVDLLSTSENRELRTEAYRMLKSKAGFDFLMEAIQDPKNKKDKGRLIAACWEAGLDCSDHLLFFIDLALENDYLISLEALTVIESMEGPFKSGELKKGIDKLNSQQEKSGVPNELIEQVLDYLKQFPLSTN